MQRVFIMVLDSFGIGAAGDADKFGDRGSDTLGHIAERCERGDANHGRNGPLKLPHLTRLGLGKAGEQSTGHFPSGLDKQAEIIGAYAYASEISSGYNIGRVIARPFVGAKAGQFERTGNRHDLAVPPPSATILQKLVEEKGGTVVSVGKIADIYAQVGISKKVKATGLDALFDATVREMDAAGDNTLVFTNFVDFDSAYGHRRDVAGYAAALELFDCRLPELMSRVKDNDILILTADHGCDPTWHGTDHTREHVPVLIYGPKVNPGFYGHRTTFADIGQTVARYFGLSPMDYGKAII